MNGKSQWSLDSLLTPRLPLLLAVLVFLPALLGGFVWDDQILHSAQIQAFGSLRDVFFPPDNIPQWSQYYYRPIVTLSYLLDLRLFGRTPLGPHLMNVLFFVITTWLVYILSRRLLTGLPGGKTGAVLAACVFAAHPIHTETISWITGRSDALAALFLLPALVLALRYRDTGSMPILLLAGLFQLLALMSKEVALAGLPLVPVLFYLTPRIQANEKHASLPAKTLLMRTGWALLVFGAMVAVYFRLRVASATGLGEEPLADGLIRALRAGGYYLVKIVVPPPQTQFAPLELTPGLGVSLALLAMVTGLALLGTLVFARQGDERGKTLCALPFFWFWLCLAPALFVALKPGFITPVAERFLFLPSVGFCLCLGGLLGPALHGRYRILAALATGLLLLAYGGQTVLRGLDWNSNLALWSKAVDKAPDHSLPWQALGAAYSDAGKPDQALECYNQALEHAEDARSRSRILYSLGTTQLDLGRTDLAIALFRQAIEAAPMQPMVYFNLGVALVEQALDREGPVSPEFLEQVSYAAKLFELAYKINPGMVDALWQKGWCHSILAAAANHFHDERLEAEQQALADQLFARVLELKGRKFFQQPGVAAQEQWINSRLEVLFPASD